MSDDDTNFDPKALETLLHDVPLDVRVNSRLVARAEAIAIGERCGIRIVELVNNGKDS